MGEFRLMNPNMFDSSFGSFAGINSFPSLRHVMGLANFKMREMMKEQVGGEGGGSMNKRDMSASGAGRRVHKIGGQDISEIRRPPKAPKFPGGGGSGMPPGPKGFEGVEGAVRPRGPSKTEASGQPYDEMTETEKIHFGKSAQMGTTHPQSGTGQAPNATINYSTAEISSPSGSFSYVPKTPISMEDVGGIVPDDVEGGGGTPGATPVSAGGEQDEFTDEEIQQMLGKYLSFSPFSTPNIGQMWIGG